MCLILQGTRFQVQVLKPCKSVQESSEEVLDFKAQQLAQQIKSIKESSEEVLNFKTQQLA